MQGRFVGTLEFGVAGLSRRRSKVGSISDIFLSYNRQDAHVARRFAEGLEREGFTVWWDQALRSGEAYDEVTEAALRGAKAVVVLWSPRSVVSRWVRAEATIADRNKTLVPAMIEPCERPIMFELTQTAELGHWQGAADDAAWLAFVDDLAKFISKPSRHPHQPRPVPQPAPVAPPLSETTSPLLAVLAFDNLSSDPELTFFCDGVSEEIQRTVASSTELRVVARSSSFQFRGAHKSIPKVAAELGCTHLLDGTVRRSGSKVRITAELVECASQNALWADRFDGDLDDVFTLQENIAEAVAEALKVKLAPPTKAPVLDPVVYEQFLRARGILADGDPEFDDSAISAAPLLEEVVHSAPDFALAWELLASARAWILRSAHATGSYEDGRSGVLHAANTALRLDPKRAGAHVALARLEPWGAYKAREELLNRALSVAPHDPEALNEMSTFCWSVGRFRDALRLAERACELNPIMPSARLHVAQMRTYVGDYEASIRMLADLHQRWPKNAGILLSLLGFSATLGFWDAYDAAVGDIATFDGWQMRSLKATKLYAEALRSGDDALKQDRLASYTTLLEKTGTIPLNIVDSVSSLGMKEEALALAERASYSHIFQPEGDRPSAIYPGVVLGRWSDLNKTVRFVDLCYRLGLCEYWMQTGAWPDCVDWTPYDFKAEVIRKVRIAG
ncbi:TIR domain-containing protein [Qipengyuania zhejiangensis]|uniref:TIR domain-containing protein n=1 Tax=Qipengyuania zhejiangensis TaxID=3077782 RepID=UPI002D78989F|nr:TIR domain-containing protein [Qipengyuania sp. Z2]